MFRCEHTRWFAPGSWVIAVGVLAAPVLAGDPSRNAGQMGDAKIRGEALIGRFASTGAGQQLGQINEVLASDDGQMMSVQILRGSAEKPLNIPRQHISIAGEGDIVIHLDVEELAAFVSGADSAVEWAD